MTIEITSPEIEALIRQRMKTGAYRNPEDIIREFLQLGEADQRTGADLIKAMQACPYPEVDLDPPRVLTPLVRDIDL